MYRTCVLKASMNTVLMKTNQAFIQMCSMNTMEWKVFLVAITTVKPVQAILKMRLSLTLQKMPRNY